MKSSYKGKYVLVRTYAAGIHFGFIKEYDPKTRHMVLKNARRLWFWKGAFTPSAVALNGVKDAKISVTLPEMIVTEVIEIMPLGKAIQKQLSEFPTYVPENSQDED